MASAAADSAGVGQGVAEKKSAFSIETGFGVYRWVGLRDARIGHLDAPIKSNSETEVRPKGRKPKKSIDLNTINQRYARWLCAAPTDRYVLISIDPARSKGSFALRIEERTAENVSTVRMSSLFLGPQFEQRYMPHSPARDIDADSSECFFVIMQQLFDILRGEFIPVVERYLPQLQPDSETNTKVVLVIERQLPDNYKLVRIQQHVMTIFESVLGHYRDFSIVEIPARLKSKQNGADPNIKAHALKTWSIDAARMLFARRRDEAGILSLTKKRVVTQRKNKAKLADTAAQASAVAEPMLPAQKVDDLADTVNQAEAFSMLVGLPCPHAGDVYAAANAAALERQRKQAASRKRSHDADVDVVAAVGVIDVGADREHASMEDSE